MLGYQPVMPTFQGVLKDKQIDALIAYIKSLKESGEQIMDGIPAYNYLNTPKGWKSWLLTRDHKRIGLMYLFAIMFFFLVGGIFALMIRIQLLTPNQALVKPETYNQLFTLHGAIMIFLFIIPSIPASLGNFVLPQLLGAKDVAFPRLNLASWYIYVVGALFLLYSIFTAPPIPAGHSTRPIARRPRPR